MELTNVDIERIAADIWAAILGFELTPHHGLKVYEPEERVVTGHVQITGDWEGAVSVQLPQSLALRAAGAMFAMEPDEVADEEVVDTVGELANMTGGNVKSTLAGSCQLSLPSVTSGRDYHVSLPGTVVRQQVGLDCDGDLVVVTLHERRAG
jgi:chemotaxis protein CheX